ncbi:hypothetical protein EVAR_56025_1 [Eumeta japonica]|uniref:Uncharacterized protein n=1 Tax=Eumeta variegata TaxID=151549 RepID=A0A4C1YM49_EUMVA|nr:hypothetical protein EVAR_56025_1 [Eumeta japonica]
MHASFYVAFAVKEGKGAARELAAGGTVEWKKYTGRAIYPLPELNNPYIPRRCNPDMQSPASSIRGVGMGTARVRRRRDTGGGLWRHNYSRNVRRSNPGLHSAQLNRTRSRLFI